MAFSSISPEGWWPVTPYNPHLPQGVGGIIWLDLDSVNITQGKIENAALFLRLAPTVHTNPSQISAYEQLDNQLWN